MNNIFNIFGSPSSKDYDIIIYMDDIPKTIKERSDACLYFDNYITNHFMTLNLPIKKTNCNLGIVQNGIITNVHKGTVDEVNNSVFTTYKYHNQIHPLQVEKLIIRDIDLKLIRSVRIILSFLSRTQYRKIVKQGLHGDFANKIESLSQIEFSKIESMGSKNPEVSDMFKSIAFQIGQILGLFQGIELYTKESIIQHFPDLSQYILRENVIDLSILDKYRYILINESLKRIPFMEKLIETNRI